MRERWARRIVLLTGLLVVLLAAVFARVQNLGVAHTPSAELPVAPVLAPESVAAGRLIYEQQSCARCHSIAGEGHPRNPLDGVGVRREAAELRDWITGAETLRGALAPSTLELKQAYGELPDAALEDLVSYLRSLRRLHSGPGGPGGARE